jgi:hypothetical protein
MGVMSCSATHEAGLSQLEERLRCAHAVTPTLLSDLTAQACVRFASCDRAARAGIERLICTGAWTDAVLALVELELPQWKRRRLVHDGGAWHCSFSTQRRLPAGLDEIAEASHDVLPLAILIAFMAALRQRPVSIEPWPQTVPTVRAAEGYSVCCDNFS